MAESRNDEVIFSEAIYDQAGIAGAPSIAYGDGTLINDAFRRWHGNTPLLIIFGHECENAALAARR